MLVSAVVGAGGAAALKVVYVLARLAWPENYFDSSRRNSAWFFDHPIRVSVWRVVPYFLVALLVISAADALSVSLSVAVASLFSLHILSTNVWAVLIDWSQGKGVQRQIAYAVALSAILLVLTCAMLSFSSEIALLSPDTESVVAGFWTAVIVGVGFGGFRVLTTVPAGEAERSARAMQIDVHYVGKAVKESRAHNVDPLLVVAVLVVEGRNRPKPLRTLELLVFRARLGRRAGALSRLKGLQSTRSGVLNPGTLGVGQSDIRSWFAGRYSGGLSSSLADVDRASIELVASRLSDSVAANGRTRLSSFEVKAAANKLNQTVQFIRSVAEVYEMLQSEYSPLRQMHIGLRGREEGSGRVDCYSEMMPVRAPWLVRFQSESYLVLTVGARREAQVVLALYEEGRPLWRRRVNLSDSGSSVAIVPVRFSGDQLVVSLAVGGAALRGRFSIYDDPRRDLLPSHFGPVDD